MFKRTEDRTKKGKELRSVFVDTLLKLMETDENIVALDGDLGGASKLTDIAKTYSDRFIQCGISEANMVGVSAGMSTVGFKPFMHTFGPFATRRVYDQIYLSGAYAGNTINIYGSDPGFCAGPNGGTHTTWEDMALMRAISNTIVCDAADEVQLAWIIEEFAKRKGVHYIRANRKACRNVYQEGSTFELGKGNLLQKGSDVLIITAGQIVSDALDCAQSPEGQNLSVSVIDMFCIKPLDKDLIIKEAKGKKAVVTFENHSIIGGLGSAVAEVLAENQINVSFKRHGVNERFGQVGTPEFLQKEFKLTAQDLEETIQTLLQ